MRLWLIVSYLLQEETGVAYIGVAACVLVGY